MSAGCLPTLCSTSHNMRLTLVTLGALLAYAIAAPSTNYVRHEKRDFLPPGWKKHEKPSSSTILPMRIGLTQSNLDKGYDYLMEVSHPESPRFGQHWTAKQVAETFAPNEESVDAVLAWLKNSGIGSDRVSRSQSMGWLNFDATVAEAESLLKTEYHIHRHNSGKPHVGCSHYHIPEHLQPHVDFVTPTVHFDTKISQARPQAKPEWKNSPLKKRDVVSSTAAAGVPVETGAAVKVITSPYNGVHPKKGADLDIQSIITELENCNQFIVPDCLRALYLFPPGISANPQNSYG